jgi:hypothetical protein
MMLSGAGRWNVILSTGPALRIFLASTCIEAARVREKTIRTEFFPCSVEKRTSPVNSNAILQWPPTTEELTSFSTDVSSARKAGARNRSDPRIAMRVAYIIVAPSTLAEKS